jgi:hypothetical protein
MDCEKFEATMIDELYDELDELTSAAMKRHVSGCARCAALIGGLRATRRVATVPMIDPPEDLEDKILAAAREAQKIVPLRGRIARFVSTAGSWAMRPQTAMAALFLVMIGTSVLLLRGKASRAPDSAAVRVTQQGAPAAPSGSSAAWSESSPAGGDIPFGSSAHGLDNKNKTQTATTTTPADEAAKDDLTGALARAKGAAGGNSDGLDDSRMTTNAAAPAGAPNTLPMAPQAQAPAQPGEGQSPYGPPPAATATTAASAAPGFVDFKAAMAFYRAGRWDEAQKAFDNLAANDPNAELMAALAVSNGKGCKEAIARFDKLAQRAAGTSTGWDALFEGARCYARIGDAPNARVRLNALLKVDSHKDKAKAELQKLDSTNASAPARKAQAAPAAKPAPQAAPTSPPAADQGFAY